MKNRLFLTLIFALSLPLAMWADKVYTIYPVPHEQLASEGQTSFTTNVDVVCGASIDQPTIDRALQILSDHGLQGERVEAGAEHTGRSRLVLGVAGSNDVADQEISKLGLSRDVFSLSKYDRHILSLTDLAGAAQVVVLGESTDATFIGLASLEYMLDNGTADMPLVTIYDYADQKDRGLVEGYYGVPYPAAVKMDLMRFMMKHKMNSYMYGAKNDPYHAGKWREPYPTSLTQNQIDGGMITQDMIRQICQVSHQTKVNFIWAIHLGNDLVNSKTVVSECMSKYEKMYKLGVRQFGVFVDDVGIPGSQEGYDANAKNIGDIQRSIEAKWNIAGAEPADTVKPIQFVNQIYALGFAGEQQRTAFYQALATTPKNIAIYITGWGVWTVPNTSDVTYVKNILGRDVSWWWNYPCNDNDKTKLFTMDMYSNFSDMTRVDSNSRMQADLQNCLGILSNPMQQGEVSKIALFSLADYAWNTAGFDNSASWTAAFPAIVGKELAADFQTLARYLRYNDGGSLSTLVNDYKKSLEQGSPSGTGLSNRMQTIINAAERVGTLANSQRESDRLLWSELSPWALRLQAMAQEAQAMIGAAAMENNSDEKWEAYVPQVGLVGQIATNPAFKAPSVDGWSVDTPLGTRITEPSQQVLRPFLDYMVQNALTGYFPAVPGKATFVSNIDGATGLISQSGQTVKLRGCKAVLSKGEYVGVCLPSPTKLEGLTVRDTLLSQNAVVWSEDGKIWHQLLSAEDVEQARAQQTIKYLCVTNLTDTPKSVSIVPNSLSLTLPEKTNVGSPQLPAGDIWENHTAKYLTDGNPETFVCVKKDQVVGDVYQVTLTKTMPVHDVRLYTYTTNGDQPQEGVVEVSADGKTWQAMKIKGKTSTKFTMSNFQQWGGEVKYCDMENTGEEGISAKYVRVRLTKVPSVSKWLRLSEIEVNRLWDQSRYKPQAEWADGSAAAEAVDGQASTLASSKSKSLIYRLQGLAPADAVCIYHDSTTKGDAQVYTSENGDDWTPAGVLSAPVTRIPVSKNDLFVKVAWSKQAPAIYEITEESSAIKLPLIMPGASTGLDAVQMNTPQCKHRVYDLQGRSLATPRRGVYIIDGKKVVVK